MSITTANARELAALSWVRRRERAAKRAEAAETVQEPEQQADYIAARLARVCAQLDRIDGMMMKESDPQKLDRLAAAQARLSDQEFKLAGRPYPGNRRPGKERSGPAAIIRPV